MEFRSHRRKIQKVSSDYPHVLQLYKVPPNGEVSLEEFEAMAFDRLKLLRVLEQATLMGHRLYSTDWQSAVIGYLRKDHLRKYISLLQSTGTNSETDAENAIRREDHISHFILRLCYCRSQDLRSWFVSREMELFKLRFLNLSAEGVRHLMNINKMNYVPISVEEKESVKDGLYESTMGRYHADIESRDFYKVPFTEVCDLVSRRIVYIKNGYAYIPSTELVACVTSLYRSNLNEALVKDSKKLPYIDDERLTGLFQNLHGSYTGRDYTIQEKKAEIEIEDLDMLSKQSYPLCMRSLHESLKATHHMKHGGRLQFGLFLKGIGVTLENSVKFWKQEFCKLIDEDKFNKGYLYNIKHSYGTIGKMTNYSPYSCMKIISNNVGTGECHGCPFKHWDNELLRRKMHEYGFSIDGIKEVADIAKSGHYQIACSKYFIHAHNGIESKTIIGHPNQYFDESREIKTNPVEKFEKRITQNKHKKANATAVIENFDGNDDWDKELADITVHSTNVQINKEEATSSQSSDMTELSTQSVTDTQTTENSMVVE